MEKKKMSSLGLSRNLSEATGINLFINFSYYTFNVYRMHNDVHSLIPDAGNLYLLTFLPLTSLATDSSVLLNLKKKPLSDFTSFPCWLPIIYFFNFSSDINFLSFAHQLIM